MQPVKIGILGSGKGSNFVAIADAVAAGTLPVEIVIVITDVLDAGILSEARHRRIPAVYLQPGKFRTRLEPHVEKKLATTFEEAGVELVVLAGFMRMLRGPLLSKFPVINIHPSLLPKYRGLEAWKQALAAGDTVTGCSVHYVDEGMDTGDVIAQATVPILSGDTPERLHERIQVAEHRLFPEVIGQLAAKIRAQRKSVQE